MAVRPYLDYYAENKIIPVRQDISDLQSHLRRRSILFHCLKIPPSAVRGQRVLEIGPGTGDNAVHIATLGPKQYTLLDGNPYSVAALNEKIKSPKFSFNKIQDLKCIEVDFLQYSGGGSYDLVLCEGIIPAQDNCAAFARRAASFVEVGGLFVVTCHSALSLLSEICRRLLKPILAAKAKNREHLLDSAITLFTPHLEQLPGRSRLVEDWVRDNILQPWPDTIVFSIEDAINALDDQFDLFATSPQFIQDFRWYKSAAIDQLSLNDLARAQLEYWGPIFVDFRVKPNDFRGHASTGLEKRCRHILKDANVAWMNDDPDRVMACIRNIGLLGNDLASIFPLTAASIKGFVRGATALINDSEVDFGDFSGWFGRGQQYASFVRRDSKLF